MKRASGVKVEGIPGMVEQAGEEVWMLTDVTWGWTLGTESSLTSSTMKEDPSIYRAKFIEVIHQHPA